MTIDKPEPGQMVKILKHFEPLPYPEICKWMVGQYWILEKLDKNHAIFTVTDQYHRPIEVKFLVQDLVVID